VITGNDMQYLKAVDGVTFSIARGETFAVVAESGSGKTTVARMMEGLLQPTSGDITVKGTSMTDPAARAERQRLRRHIQMIFQDLAFELTPKLT
jgi:peptide/nickel transport system ATP-binding protein